MLAHAMTLPLYISKSGVTPNGIFRPCVRWVREVGRFRKLFTYPRVRLSAFFRKSAVSCERGTHLAKKCDFVQEGHTFLENVCFRARGGHISGKNVVSYSRGTHSLKKYGFLQEGRTFLEKILLSASIGIMDMYILYTPQISEINQCYGHAHCL